MSQNATPQIKSESIKMVPIKELKPWPKNRNKHSKEQIERLTELIQYQGFRNPVVVCNQNGFVVAGHGRLMAAKKLKMKEVPTIYQDFDSDEQIYAYMVSDNAIASWAELDLSGINTDIIDLGPELDINLLGIKNFEIDIYDREEPMGDPDAIPDKVEPKAKLGDIYQLGQHRLMCGDSTNVETIKTLMNGQKAEMVFTDPPYNQETEGGFTSPIGSAFAKQSAEIRHLCDFEPADFLNVLPTVFSKNVMNSYCFCNKDLVVDYLKWAQDAGYSYNILVWKKPSAIPIGGSYRPDIEYLLVFRRSGTFNGNISDVNYSKVLEHKREINKVHPTMKPVEMIENQIKIASDNGSNVVDFFGGSGSTLIACEKTNRKCFMMELDPHYIDVIIARWEKYTGKTAELING